jgi:hypothetical protein
MYFDIHRPGTVGCVTLRNNIFFFGIHQDLRHIFSYLILKHNDYISKIKILTGVKKTSHTKYMEVTSFFLKGDICWSSSPRTLETAEDSFL